MPTPGYRIRLGIEQVTAYLGRDVNADAEDYITMRLAEHGVTPEAAPLVTGLVFLAELLALQVAHAKDPNATDLRAKACEVLQDMALGMPE